jgi:hypothetical protein
MKIQSLHLLSTALILPLCGATAEVTFTRVDAGDIGTDLLHCQALAWGDYDGDGWVDLFAGYNTFKTDPEPDRLYHNNGDGTFTRILDGGIADDAVPSYTMSAVWADFENDGDLDLYLTQNKNFAAPAVDRFYLNNGDGTFVRGGQDWITLSYSITASWADYDNDGLLDIFVAGNASFFGHHQPDGSVVRDYFTDFRGTQIFAGSWSDYNDDGLLDLFVPDKDIIYRNDGDGVFTPDPRRMGSMTSFSLGDYDNDGDPDLAIVHFEGQHIKIYRNNGDSSWTFVPGIAAHGEVGFRPPLWADYDNDGYLDLFIPNTANPDFYDGAVPLDDPNILYHNNGDGTFTRIIEGPLVTELGMSFAAGWADYDNDGDLDVVLSDGQNFANESSQLPAAPLALYRNDGGNDNNWLNLSLVGTLSNRSAIGAKVFAHANVNGVAMQQMREVGCGKGGFGQSDMRVHFGLGDAAVVDTLRIVWPSGTVQEMQDVAANQFMTIEEAGLTWAGYPVIDGWADTGDFMGWLYIGEDPWVISTSMDGHYIFCPEGHVGESGAWVYVPK